MNKVSKSNLIKVFATFLTGMFCCQVMAQSRGSCAIARSKDGANYNQIIYTGEIDTFQQAVLVKEEGAPIRVAEFLKLGEDEKKGWLSATLVARSKTENGMSAVGIGEMTADFGVKRSHGDFAVFFPGSTFSIIMEKKNLSVSCLQK